MPQVAQQAPGPEAAGRDGLGVGQQEQPVGRETGDPEPAHTLAARDAQPVSPDSTGLGLSSLEGT